MDKIDQEIIDFIKNNKEHFLSSNRTDLDRIRKIVRIERDIYIKEAAQELTKTLKVIGKDLKDLRGALSEISEELSPSTPSKKTKQKKPNEHKL